MCSEKERECKRWDKTRTRKVTMISERVYTHMVFWKLSLKTLWKNPVQIWVNLFLPITNLYQKIAEASGKRTFTNFLMICCKIQIFHWGIGLSYRPFRLYRLTEWILWNRSLGSLKVYKFGIWRVGTSKRVVVPDRQAGNRFLGSLKGIQIRALYSVYKGQCLWSRKSNLFLCA